MENETDVVDTVEKFPKEIVAGTQDSGDAASNTDGSA